MRRRDFITFVASAATWPLATHAQSTRIPHVGLMSIGADPSNPGNLGPFLEQMRELGYIDGKNVRFEPRVAAGQVELLDGFVADLLTRRVDIIVATGLREAAAAKRATSSVPIVTIVHPDPLAAGLAQSISRPGSNVTGLATMEL